MRSDNVPRHARALATGRRSRLAPRLSTRLLFFEQRIQDHVHRLPHLRAQALPKLGDEVRDRVRPIERCTPERPIELPTHGFFGSATHETETTGACPAPGILVAK